MYQELMSHCEEPNTSLPSLWNFCLKSRCVESKNMQGPFSSPLPSSKCSRLCQGISKFLSAFRTRNISSPSWQIEMLGIGWIFHVDPHYMHPESWGDAGNSPDDYIIPVCFIFFPWKITWCIDHLITWEKKKKKVFFFPHLWLETPESCKTHPHTKKNPSRLLWSKPPASINLYPEVKPKHLHQNTSQNTRYRAFLPSDFRAE